MNEWTVYIEYSGKSVPVKAKLEYHGESLMRIRIIGKKGILLECNYSELRRKNSKRGIKWQIKEGVIHGPDPSSIFLRIIRQLERFLKQDYPPQTLIPWD